MGEAAKKTTKDFPRLSQAWDVARIRELEAALKPFADYAEKRDTMPLKGMGDSVHRIHLGTEFEAEITQAHCRHALLVLKEEA